MSELQEITPTDQKFIETSLNVNVGGIFDEEITCQCPIYSSEDDNLNELVPRILVIGKYRVLLIKKEKNEKKFVKKSIHLYDLIQITETLSTTAHIGQSNIIEVKYKETTTTSKETTTLVKSFLIQSPNKEIETIIIKTFALTAWSISKGFPREYLLSINMSSHRYPNLKFDHEIGITDGKGIAEQYIAHSHYFNTKSTLDFLRHLETLYQTRYPELDLSEIAGIDASSSLGFNLYTSVITLRHNNFIKSIRASGIPHINVTSSIGEMMLTNKTITELIITNLLVEQSFAPIGKFLKYNTACSLQVLNLSNNILSYESVVAICDGLAHFNHSLVTLNLSNCSIPSKGISLLFDSFSKNLGMSCTLETLALSDNRFQDAGSNAISTWLNRSKGYNQLKVLSLSNTQLSISIVAPSLKSLSHLVHLDLSKNSMNIANARSLSIDGLEPLESKQFQYLNLSYCGLVGDSVATLLVALSRNFKLSNVTLNFQNNGFANKTYLVLLQMLPQCSAFLKGLDLSFNGFNSRQIQDIVQCLTSSCNLIESLDIGNNLFDVEIVPKLIDLVKLGKLQKLGVGHQTKSLGASLHPLLTTVGASKSMQVLDIVGNELNDHGACILSDCIRHNKSLKKLYISGNKFTLAGWTSLASPFLFYRNTNLIHIDLPSLSDQLLVNDSGANNLVTPLKREQIELNLFSKIRFQLQLNKNKVPQSSRFAYLPSVDPPTYIVPLADLPDNLLQYTITNSNSRLDSQLEQQFNNLNINNLSGNGSIKINLNIGGSSGSPSANNTVSSGHSISSGGRPSLTSIFSKPIHLINDIRGNENGGGIGGSNNNSGNNSQYNSRVSTPVSWNDDDNWKNNNRNDDDNDDLK